MEAVKMKHQSPHHLLQLPEDVMVQTPTLESRYRRVREELLMQTPANNSVKMILTVSTTTTREEEEDVNSPSQSVSTREDHHQEAAPTPMLSVLQALLDKHISSRAPGSELLLKSVVTLVWQILSVSSTTDRASPARSLQL